jgi:hypothetical protein
MFNFPKFKSPKFKFAKSGGGSTISPVVSPFNKTKYSKDITQIHNEFEEAGKLLLSEAKKILNTFSEEKTKRLKKMGFNSIPQVIEHEELKIKIVFSKKLIELIEYYSFYYPSNKFITEDQVESICKKYNLVCGDVGLYKGFVPDYNLRMIENFKLRKEDQGVVEIVNTCIEHYSLGFYKNSKLPEGKYVYSCSCDRDEDINDDIRDMIGKARSLGISPSHMYFVRLKDADNSDFKDLPSNKDTCFKICAPIKDMEMKGMEVSRGYSVMKHIPDPIVLQPVVGGYLIVTAWGDEASDPEVQNPKNN